MEERRVLAFPWFFGLDAKNIFGTCTTYIRKALYDYKILSILRFFQGHDDNNS